MSRPSCITETRGQSRRSAAISRDTMRNVTASSRRHPTTGGLVGAAAIVPLAAGTVVRGVQALEAGEEVERGGLAEAAGADEAEGPTRADRQRQPAHGAHPPDPLGEPACLGQPLAR